MIPKLLTNELNIHSLHSINCYQQMIPIGCALSDECGLFIEITIQLKNQFIKT